MASSSSSYSSSSPRCVPFPFRRGGARAPAAAGCGRPLCRAAELVGGGIRGAFFASLDRCYCVEVRTQDDVDAAAAAAPLMMVRDDGAAASATASAGDGQDSRRRRLASGGKGKQRRGRRLPCCAASGHR